jgi:hypothetical protein
MRGAASWVVAVLVLLGSGCLSRVPRQRLAERAKVAVVYLVDRGGAGEPWSPPGALKESVAAELELRNLEAIELPIAALAGQRLTDGRLEALRQASADAPFLLLVEQRVTFFSQIDGRYRWEVGTSLSALRRGGGAAAKDPFEQAVLLRYDHEREVEAVARSASEVSTRAAALLDALIAGAGGLTTPPKAAREPAPFRPHAVYFVMVDRFANGDPSNDGDARPADPQGFHGGDLPGLIARLDWLQALGVDTVWLSPISRMRTAPWQGHGAFHGYWTWALGELEPRFGAEADVRRLRDELDRRGMKLVLDLVLNHVGPDAPLLARHPDWFHRRGGVTDWGDARQLVEHDVHGLPDLAQEKPEVYRHLVDSTRRWLPAGAA